jgi:CDP-paratose 2-epimerase
MKKAAEILITGGAGFIGTNLAHRLLRAGRSVRIFDNLARPGVEENMAWLHRMHKGGLETWVADIRDRVSLRAALDGVQQVFHLAAQVAVTTSLEDPVSDFEVNAHGTLNLLEEIRSRTDPPGLIFTSTNKVYGALADLELQRRQTRYAPANRTTEQFGISERRPLDFHSPYGCSKGAADQYVLDYARIYGVPAVVFRMSCIYGPHQCGTEDQGWIAHFLARVLDGEPITVYGDGMQVRDILFVDDLVDAFLCVSEHIKELSGRPFNVGGGPANSISLVELLEMIQEIHRQAPPVSLAGWRAGDQRYYVSDTRRLRDATGWAPRTGAREGVRKLYEWLLEARSMTRPALLAGTIAS